jgi:hypothetical protein
VVVSDETLEIPERDLFEVYSLLADATDEAAGGDFMRCASLASDAKKKVKEIHTEATD